MEKTEEQLLKDITNGKYKDCYLIYNRKSTDEPDNQKNSITYQKSENGKFVYREKLRIAPITIKGFCVDGIISERHSGFKEDNDIKFSEDGMVQFKIDRPKFQQLSIFLSKKLFKGSISLCWDRISRNKGDDAIVRKLMRSGIDFRFTFAKYDKTSSGALHMDIDGMFAEHHSRVTSEKVSTTIWNLRERGICTYRAPIGYLNPGEMGNKPFDLERSPIIKKIFELYASDAWSLSDLARYANNQGLTTVPMRRRRTEEEMLAEEDEIVEIEPVSRPITTNFIHKILTNQFYLGKILGNDGRYIKSISHEALVSEELFNKVQKVLKKKKVSIHYTDKLDYYLRGIIYCGECGRVCTPYEQKGIQYFGSRCIAGCKNKKKSFNLDFIEEEIGKMMNKLYFTDDELVEIDARIKTDIAIFEEKRNRELEKNDRRKKKLREDLAYLRANKLTLLKTGTYSPEEILGEENKLNGELSVLQGEEQASDISMHEMIKEVVKLSELLKNAGLYYSYANSEEKEKIARIIFSELFVTENMVNCKCKNGFQALEKRFVAVCDPTENRTLITALRRRCPNR